MLFKRINYVYDTETTGLELNKNSKAFAFSYSRQGDGLNAIPLREVRDNNYQIIAKEIWKPGTKVIMHNAKFDISASETIDGVKVPFKHSIEDTSIMSCILKNNNSHALKDLAYSLCGIPVDDEREVKDIIGLTSNDYSKVRSYIMDKYQKRDIERTDLLYGFFKPKIEANPRFQEIYEQEIELVWHTREMERRGLQVNINQTKKMISEFKIIVAECREQLPDWCVPSRDACIRELLFDHLGLPSIKKTKSGKLESVDKHVLHILYELHTDCKEIQTILKYRSYSKGITTLLSYLEFADSDGVIHPSIHTNGASTTGRQSCSKPNLQNVSKEKALLNPYPIPARKCFKPREGYINIHIDFSSIEMRLIVHYSRDKNMIEVLKNNGDPHNEAASLFYQHENRWINALLNKDTKKLLRDASKNCHFAFPYGASKAKMALILDLPKKIADIGINAYAKRFPGVLNVNKTTASEAKKNGGFIETEFGRKLFVPMNKLYVALNYRIQGTASEILKRSENRVANYLLDMFNYREAQQILPIHDEIIIEYPIDKLNQLDKHMNNIRYLMTDFPEFSVPMDIEADITTDSWANKIKYEFKNKGK